MSLTKEIRSSRRTSGLSHLPYSLDIVSLSDVDNQIRKEDAPERYRFNARVKGWSEYSVLALRRSVKSLIRNDVLLSDSIRANLYYDNKHGKEVQRVGFSFAREGIFIHKGARRGRGGVIGSSWINRHGVRKFRAPESAGKQSGGIEWFDPVIEKRIPQLADIVAEYSADLQVNATNLFIDK